MPSIYSLKAAFQRLLQPLLGILIQMNITPNQITIAAFCLSLFGGGLIWSASFTPYLLLFIPLILLLRMALNALDGMLARNYQKSSTLGEILNEVGDVISDTVFYLPLILLQNSLIAILFISLFVVLASINEFSGVLAKAMIGDRRYDGPMGKSDRAFVVSLYCIVLFFWPSTIQSASISIFLALNAFLMISSFNRLKAILEKQK